MSMRLVGVEMIAVIDPVKKFKEPGQLIKYKAGEHNLEDVVIQAREEKKEIRYYLKGLETNDGEKIASQVIITDIPPGHVQPFHTHKTIHEMTVVESGKIVAVDHEGLNEEDVKDHLFHHSLSLIGAEVCSGQMVIEGPGTRHTIVNPTETYARLYTIQTARMPIDKFPADWHRDGK